MAKDKNQDPKVDEKLDGVIPPKDQPDLKDGEVKVGTAPDTEIKVIDQPKNVTNTMQAAEVVAGGSNSNGNLRNAPLGAISFSGSAAGIKDDLSATTKGETPYRSSDRSGKRDDSQTRNIDEMNSEIFRTKIKQSKALYEDPEGPGWNGNYENEHVITQRRSGGSPADPNFERSFDFLASDLILYASGQYNNPKSSDEHLSIRSWDVNANNGAGGYTNPITVKLGDFIARNLHVEIGYDGKIQVFRADVDDITPTGVDELTYRMAGDARLRDRNQIELDREVMIRNAGNESDPKWSCLGDTIIDPTDQNYITKLFEQIMGDYSTVSYRKGSQAMSFFLNKTKKDGKRKMGPMAELLNHCVPGINDGYHAESGASVLNDCFYNGNILSHGGSGLYVAVSDSLPKYNTKGKLINLPLGIKAPLATAYKNLEPLKTSSLLQKSLKKHELYSIIDGPYDPLRPIVCTDGVSIVERINPFTGFSVERMNITDAPASGKYVQGKVYAVTVADFDKTVDYVIGDLVKHDNKYYRAKVNHSHGNWNGDHFELINIGGDNIPRYMILKVDATAPDYNITVFNDTIFDFVFSMDQFNPVVNDIVYVQHYENVRNKYNRPIRNCFAYGLYTWFERKASRILDHFRSSRMTSGRITDIQGVTLDIPITSTMMGISLWDLIVCESIPDMLDARRLVFKELIDYVDNFGYPYTGLESVKVDELLQSENFTHSDYLKMIDAGVISGVAANRIKFPELFWPVAKFPAYSQNSHHSGVGAKVVLPSYFSQNQFRYDQTDDDTCKKLILSDNFASAGYPSERVGCVLQSIDNIYNDSEEQWRLSLDRMVVYPAYEGCSKNNFLSKIASYADGEVGEETYPKYDALTYKYGINTDGIPVIPYFAYASDASNKTDALTIRDILSTPRELGIVQTAPAGYVTPTRNTNDNNTNYVNIDSSYLQLSGPGFKMYLYHSCGDVEHDILLPGNVNVNIDDSLFNVYDIIRSIPSDANTDIGCTLNALTGAGVQQAPFVANSYDDDDYVYNAETATYEANLEAQDTNMALGTSHKYLWTRLQRLPFVVNPFDVNTADLSSASDFTLINNYDVFDFLIIFGFCGFRASDYKAQVNKRAKQRIDKGMNYVEDPFLTNSSLSM